MGNTSEMYFEILLKCPYQRLFLMVFKFAFPEWVTTCNTFWEDSFQHLGADQEIILVQEENNLIFFSALFQNQMLNIGVNSRPDASS